MNRHMAGFAGIAFGVLTFVGFSLGGFQTPDFGAPDGEWLTWAQDQAVANRIAVLAALLAGVAFLLFMGELRDRQSGPLGRTGAAGGLVGVVGMVAALTLLSTASGREAQSDVAITRALVESTGLFILAPLGFGTYLLAGGLATLRTGAFARWVGIVSLVGAGAFLLTFLTVFDSTGEESPFGVGFPIGFLCLAISSIAMGVRLSGAAAPSPAQPLPSTR